jgi:hypothetical protein
MARHEHDREDLIAEATALDPRVELEVPGCSQPIVLGLRNLGWLSLYFGGDPVFHFDAAGGLRRAFVSGALYLSQGTTLARLVRARTGDFQSELLRTDLSADELATFFDSMTQSLRPLHAAIDLGNATVLRQASTDQDPLPRLRAALEGVLPARLSAAIRARN